MKQTSYRNQEWLESLLAIIWNEHFDDVPQSNEVRIVYGRKAKRRLGSISRDRVDPSVSIITINSIFQDLEVPEFVIKATIVHEMTHYTHGFNSPLEQKQKHPHSGGVIRREFAERGLEDLFVEQKKWLKEYWPALVEKYFPGHQRSIVRYTTKSSVPLPWWMRGMR